MPLAVSLQDYLPTFTYSLAQCLASSAIPRVYSLKHSLKPSPRCHSLTTVTMLCNRLDIRRRALQSKSQAPNTTPRTGATASATTVSSTSSGIAPGLIDLSASCPRLTAEEQVKRMAEGRCYRCGGVGHMARQYPLGQGQGHKQPMQAAATATKDAEALN